MCEERKPIVIKRSVMNIKEFMKEYYDEELEKENLDIDTFETLYPDIWTYDVDDIDDRLENGETDLVLVKFIELDGSELERYVETETVGGFEDVCNL